jgi:two-component system C4-dicarboxylate transport response regulator DctD
MARILLIDDDPLCLDSLALTLRLGRKDEVVETARTAETALLLTAAARFDAIVSDIRMPGMDGIDLLKEARSVQANTPVLLITGDDDLDLQYHALLHGAYAFIQKPVDPDMFLTTLDRAIRQS